MAIRKFRKIMKPISFIVMVALCLSGLWATWSSMTRDHSGAASQYACRVNGDKITKLEVNQVQSNLSEQLTKRGVREKNQDLVALYAFQQSVNEELTLQLAEAMKISVSSSAVRDEYKKIEESIGNREQFTRMLSMQGYSKKAFKDKLEKDLIIQACLQKFQEEGAKEGVPGQILYQEALGKERAKMKMTKIAQEYEACKVKVVEEKDGFQITNLDLAERELQMMLMTGMSETEAKKVVQERINQELLVAKAAKAEGIEIDASLPFNLQMMEYGRALFVKYSEDVLVDDAALEAYFNANQERYQQHASVDVNLAVMKISVSKEDQAAIETLAETRLKELTMENFEELGKTWSAAEPGKVLYEELGWFEKGKMVKEFEKAAFSAKEAEIYPKVIETAFGEHLMFVQAVEENRVKAAHILFRNYPGEDSLVAADKEAEKLQKKLEAKKISFENIKSVNKDILFTHHFDKVDQSGVIPGFVQDPALVAAIYASPLGSVGIYKPENVDNAHLYLFQKTAELEEKEIHFDEVKEQVQKEYRLQKAEEKMAKLVK